MTDAPEASGTRVDARWSHVGFWVLSILSLAGILLALLAFVRGYGIVRPGDLRLGIFHVLFVRHEPKAILVLWLLAVLCRFSIRREPGKSQLSERVVFGSGAYAVYGVIAATLAITWLGTSALLHDYPFSMDEHTLEFQAEVFLEGQWAARIPGELVPLAEAAKSPFVEIDRIQGTWNSAYLPVYSALRALLKLVHPGALLNPILAALSLMMIARVARRLWPGIRWAPWLAVLFLGTSAQFLITSMTFYSMPAHLVFNLIWLELYLRDERWAWACLPAVGFLAMGLHQYAMHVVFAGPLLATVCVERRWRLSAWLLATYGAALVVWVGWMEHWREQGNLSILNSHWGIPNLERFLRFGMELVLSVTWHAPAMGMLVVLALFSFHRLSPPMRYVAASLVATYCFYLFYRLDQGHGWGYRYAYPVLGNFALLAVAGSVEISRRFGTARSARFLAISFLAAIAVQLPLRATQVEATVRPFAQASSYLAEQNTDIVLIDGTGNWYAQDLVRNDPWLREKPIVLQSHRLYSDQLSRLLKTHDVSTVLPHELERIGLPVTSLRPEHLSIRSRERMVDPAPSRDGG